MARILVLLVVVMGMAAPAALAAGLSDNDYRILLADFGLTQQGWMIRNMTADEQSDLHRIMNDPDFANFPDVRSDNMADYLYQVHIRECQSWSQSNGGGQACPPTGDQTVDLGQDLAERHCNYCHLFGTPGAPSFHKLAARGALTEQRLADALARGHEMSPIGLQPQEISALFKYIVSTK